MIHTSIMLPGEEAEDEQAVIDHIARKLTIGARRAMLKLTMEWQTAREGYFSTSGARFLQWQYQDLGLAERKKGQVPTKGRRDYDFYRLTPLGRRVQKSLVRQGIS